MALAFLDNSHHLRRHHTANPDRQPMPVAASMGSNRLPPAQSLAASSGERTRHHPTPHCSRDKPRTDVRHTDAPEGSSPFVAELLPRQPSFRIRAFATRNPMKRYCCSDPYARARASMPGAQAPPCLACSFACTHESPPTPAHRGALALGSGLNSNDKTVINPHAAHRQPAASSQGPDTPLQTGHARESPG